MPIVLTHLLLVTLLSAAPVSHGPASTRWATQDTITIPVDSVLTTEAMSKMAAFMDHFKKEPDSVRTTGRLAHPQQGLYAVGTQLRWVKEVDMVALAAQYPSIATDLRRAGLTAVQWEAYRHALYDASLNQQAGPAPGRGGPNSPLGKNMTFLAAHQALVDTLQGKGFGLPTLPAQSNNANGKSTMAQDDSLAP